VNLPYVHLAICLALVAVFTAAAYWLVMRDHRRAPPVVAKESVMEDLDRLLDTGTPTWRAHRDGKHSITYCEDQDCPKEHFDYSPFRPIEASNDD
jgi:hypothetical protein